MPELAQLANLGLDPNLLRLLAKRQEAEQARLQPEQQVVSEAPAQIETVAQIPTFTPEERESLLSSVGRKSLNGLQWLGESLDKPGRAVRGLLSGILGGGWEDLNEVADIIPFSDTLGLTTPEDDVWGRDLLERVGLPANTPGLDAGDVAGVALEIAIDPFNLITLGGAPVASKMLKEGAASAKAITPAAKIAEIASGARPLVSFHTPAFGIPLPSKIPFTDIPLPYLSLPVKELGQYGTGEGAAKVYEALNYGKYSPNPYVRKLFSSIPEVTAAPIKDQKLADMHFETKVAAKDKVAQEAIEMFGREAKVAGQFGGLVDKTFFRQDGGRAALIADAVKEVSATSQEVALMVKSKFGDAPDWAKIKADRKQLAEAERLYAQITTNQKQYGQLADDLKTRHEELLASVFEGANSPDPLHAKWFDDSLRTMVEDKSEFGLASVIERMKAGGLNPSVEGFDEAAQAMHSLVDEMRVMYPKHLKELNELGVDVPTLNDYFANYSHRRSGYKEGSAAANYIQNRFAKKISAPFMMIRDSIYRHFPGGTAKLNDATRNPLFNKHTASKAWEQVSDVHAPDLSTAPQPGSYLEGVWNTAKQEGIVYPTLRGYAQEVMQEAAQASAEMIARKKTISNLASQVLGGDWRKLVNKVVAANSDYTTLGGFDEVAQMAADRFPGMSSDMLWEELKSHGKSAKVVKTQEQVAAEALQRYRAAEAANSATGEADDFFDVAKDPTAYPNPAFGGAKLKWTRDNAAFLLAKQYDLPAWWNYDKILRAKVAEGVLKDPALEELAKNADLSDEVFKQEWWKYQKAKETGMPPENQWATQSADADDFTINAKAINPDLNAIPILSQGDLHDLVNRLYHMPKEVLDQGLFNRGTVTDAVDYMLQASKVKTGVATMRSMLRQKGIVRDTAEAGGVPLQQFWKETGLTDQGLASFAKELWGDLKPEELTKKLSTAHIDTDIASSLGRYVEAFRDPEGVSEIMKWVDAGNSLWKGTMTVPYPAFHTRNRLSGLWANWAVGIFSSDGEKYANDLFHGKLNTSEAEEFLREIKVYDVAKRGANADNQAMDKLAQYQGIGDDVTPTGGLLRHVFNPFGELVQDTREAFKAGGIKGAAKQLFKGGTRADGSTATDINPFGMKGALDPLGKAGRANQLDDFGQPLKGAALGTAQQTTNAVYKAGINANEYVEWMNRVGPYMAMRKNGWPPALAARKVKQVQFDYRELSPLERRIFRRVIPFYSFMRKNFEQQSRLLMSNPGGRTAQAIRIENNAAREGKGKEGYVPKYLAESFAFRLPGGNESEAKYFSQSGLLPFEEAFNRFSFDDGLNPLNMQRTGEKFLAQSHPLIQGPMEYISGKQLWSGRSLDDLYQSPTSDQDVNLLLSKLPTSRLTGTIGGIFDDRKNIVEKAFNLAVGGAKITDVNPAKQRSLEIRDILEQTLSADPDIAKYTGLYANDMKSLVERYNAGDQEAARMLKFYQNIAAELRAIKKAEQPVPAG